jgi:tRNA pseudouridine38-40 synthase
MTLAYDGTSFSGWQRQRGFPTIQGAVEACLERITGERPNLEGSGRTDAGVHALGQVANFRTGSALPAPVLLRAANALLPPSIRILNLDPAPFPFHARRAARQKRYAYRFFLSRHAPPFGREYALHVKYPLDLERMRQAGRLLVGRRDFAALATNPGEERRSTVRTLSRLHLVRRGADLWLVVQGDGFLYNMVRTIAGTLLEVGRGRFAPSCVAGILASRDRRRAGPVLPARGLVLLRVAYGGALGGKKGPGRWGTAFLRTVDPGVN